MAIPKEIFNSDLDTQLFLNLRNFVGADHYGEVIVFSLYFSWNAKVKVRIWSVWSFLELQNAQNDTNRSFLSFI
jgi:hypothetical protein